MKLDSFSLISLVLLGGIINGQSSENSNNLKDRYIIKFKPYENYNFKGLMELVTTYLTRNKDFPNKITYELEQSINGFSAVIDSTSVKALAQMPFVSRVSTVKMAKLQAVQTGATWGISRVSSRTMLKNPPYNFKYKPLGGDGVTMYILDSGINLEHDEFEGRAVWGVTIPKNSTDTDTIGHGTHCAGTIGAKTYGIAKKVKLVAVKVFDGDSGPDEDVLAGIEWVLKNAKPEEKSAMLISLSSTEAGEYTSSTLVDAVNTAWDRNILTTIAAGNNKDDACNYAPGRSDKAITVAATTIEDKFNADSNFGCCVTLLAPGKDIESTWIGSSTAINTMSGTSTAAAHVAGLVSIYMSSDYPTKLIKDRLLEKSTKEAISDVPEDTPNISANFPMY